MSGMDVARAVISTYTLVVASHLPVKNNRDIPQVEASHRSSICCFCGSSPGQTCGIVWLTVCVGTGNRRVSKYLE